MLSANKAWIDKNGRLKTENMWQFDIRYTSCHKSFWKCNADFNVMFISIKDFNTGKDSDSTFSIIMIDPMQQPEETLKYDKNTNLNYQKWIQVRNSKQY